MYDGIVAEQAGPKGRVCVPGQVIDGGVTSSRFTKKEQVAVLLEASVAVSVTVEAPKPDTVLPAAGDWVTTGVLQLSATTNAL